MVDLLPCPFCGGEPEVEQYGTTRRSAIIACTWCGARLESNETRDTGDQWNTRSDGVKAADLKITRVGVPALRDDLIELLRLAPDVTDYEILQRVKLLQSTVTSNAKVD